MDHFTAMNMVLLDYNNWCIIVSCYVLSHYGADGNHKTYFNTLFCF